MRVGYLQFGPLFGSKKENHERVADFLSGVKAHLIVLPELYSTGYLFESKQELMDFAEDEGGESFTFLKQISRDTGAAIVASIAERVGEDCFNTCLLCSQGEIRAKYRKIHLFDREK
jgi:predicted amidohydrolase